MKKSLKASYTIEAAMVVPIILLFLFQGMSLGIALCREVQEASVYSEELRELSGAEIFRNAKEREKFVEEYKWK